MCYFRHIMWDIPTMVPWNAYFVESKYKTVSTSEIKKYTQTHISRKMSCKIKTIPFLQMYFWWAHKLLNFFCVDIIQILTAHEGNGGKLCPRGEIQP